MNRIIDNYVTTVLKFVFSSVAHNCAKFQNSGTQGEENIDYNIPPL